MPVYTARQGRGRRFVRAGRWNAPVRAVVWGDSHAEAMAPGIADFLREHQAAALYAGRRACPPLVGVSRPNAAAGEACLDFNESMLVAVARSGARDVVLIGRWNQIANGSPRHGIESGKYEFLIVDQQSGTPSVAENREVLVRGFERTLRRLASAGERVWVMEEVPYRVRCAACTGAASAVAPAWSPARPGSGHASPGRPVCGRLARTLEARRQVASGRSRRPPVRCESLSLRRAWHSALPRRRPPNFSGRRPCCAAVSGASGGLKRALVRLPGFRSVACERREARSISAPEVRRLSDFALTAARAEPRRYYGVASGRGGRGRPFA